MAKFFRGPGSKAHFLLNFIPLSIIFGIFLFSIVMKDNNLPGENNIYTLTKPTTIHSVFKRDTVTHKLKKGERIRILGYDNGSSAHPYSLWAETDKGYRGTIDITELGVPTIAWDEDNNKIDTVTIISRSRGDFQCRFSDGSEKKIDFNKIMPVLPDSLELKSLSETSKYNYYMTPEKFSQEYIGKSLIENENRYRPALNIATLNDSLRALYPIIIIDSNTGERYSPIVTYDKSLNAVSFSPTRTDDRSDWLISLLPFFGSIIDNSFFVSFIEGSLFETYLTEDINIPWWLYCWAVIAFIGSLVWFFFTPLIPALAMNCLTHFPKAFYPFGNRTLRYIILGVMILSTYVWTILMLAWGMYWIFIILIIIVFLIGIGYILTPLLEEKPCFRCLGCRSMGTMEFSHAKFHSEYDKWMREMEYVKTVDRQVSRWKTWTEVTTTYGDGHKETSKQNEQNHKRVTTTKLYDDYNVLYHVKVYENTYKCCCCGQIEHTYPEKYKEIDRKYLGAHTETTSTES